MPPSLENSAEDTWLRESGITGGGSAIRGAIAVAAIPSVWLGTIGGT